MARVTCAISGIRFNCSYFEHLNIPHTEGFVHPIFATSHKQLHYLYSAHCRGELTSNDSYLLFMAFLHSSGKVTWKYPSSCNPNELRTKQLIENNIAQLVAVLEKTAIIRHPSFIQPSFNVTHENCNLDQIKNWIKAWEYNIRDFYTGRISDRTRQELVKVENRLSKLILSGEDPKTFSHVIANWADKTADFPPEQADKWKDVISSCFSINKMFNTPLPLLKEIKDYCECNIEVGSIHFHTLSHVLKEGISRHIDYLGGSSLALGYTLLSTSSVNTIAKAELKNSAELATLAAKAPSTEPVETNYSTSLEFLRARLAYRVASTVNNQKEKEEL